MQSEAIDQLATALSKAQGEIKPALKDNTNPHFKSKYADLSSVWEACRSQLSKNGLAVVQTVSMENGQMMLVTTLMHSSGQWIRSTAPIISQRQDSQAIGSAITYMRRYSLSAMVGIAPDDDDAEASMARKKKQEDDTISKSDAESLLRLVNTCSPEYQKIFDNYLIKNKTTIYDIPVSMYQNFLSRASHESIQYKDYLKSCLQEQLSQQQEAV